MRIARAFGRKRPNRVAKRGGVVAGAVATALIGALIGDSRTIGVNQGERPSPDLAALPAGVYQIKQDNSISQTLPLDHTAGFAGPDRVGFGESYAVQRKTDTGLPYYIIPRGIGGSAAYSAGDVNGWVGNNLTPAIASINAGIAAAQAATPGAVFNEVVISLGTNDSYTPSLFATAMDTIESRLRAEIYKNGVSGATVGSALNIVYLGMRAEHRETNPNIKNVMEGVLREHGSRTNNKYLEVVRNSAYDQSDHLHENNPGVRNLGPSLGALFTDTTPAVLSGVSSYTVYADQKVALRFTADKYVRWAVNDPAFEFADTWWNTTSGPNTDIITSVLRGAGDAAIPAGTYNLVLTARTGAGVVSTKNVTFTSVAAYGTQVEPIVVSFPYSFQTNSTANDYQGRNVFPNMVLKRGVNNVLVSQTGGSVTGTTLVTSTGLVGVRDAASVGADGYFRIYSAQDQICDGLVTPAGAASSGFFCTITNVVGTTATPTSVFLSAPPNTGNNATTSLTVPASGVAVGQGVSTGGYGPQSGQTSLSDPGSTGAVWAGFRTTTGVLSGAAGFSTTLGTAWAKA